MWEKYLASLIQEHRGKVIGVILGLIASILFINYGFWKTAFIVLCIALGYFIGKRLDENGDIRAWFKQFFPDK